MLSDKGVLLKLFTQNIDCLERSAGVPDDKIVEAHGSFARQSCIDCRSSFPEDLMKQAIDAREVPHCQTPQCNGMVKPDIVFFGEQLPEKFHQNKRLPMEADLCIIMGTSLSVQPFASLPGFVEDHVPRLLINLERVGGLGSRADDVLLLGDCDTGVRKFARALGWEEDLEMLWNATRADTQEKEVSQAMPHKSRDEVLIDEIANLADEVEKSLQISTTHRKSVQDLLSSTEQQQGRDDPNVLKQISVDNPCNSGNPEDKRIRETAETLPHEDKIYSKKTIANSEQVNQSKGSEPGVVYSNRNPGTAS
jgi:NAD-dependent histone deacetylase SIR2